MADPSPSDDIAAQILALKDGSAEERGVFSGCRRDLALGTLIGCTIGWLAGHSVMQRMLKRRQFLLGSGASELAHRRAHFISTSLKWTSMALGGTTGTMVAMSICSERLKQLQTPVGLRLREHFESQNK